MRAPCRINTSRCWLFSGLCSWAFLGGLTAWNASSLAAAPTGDRPKYDPTDQYDVQKIEGWRVMVNKSLQRDHSRVCAEELKLLGCQLCDIERRVPAEAVAKLRKIAIWVEYEEPHHPCATYHPDAKWLRENDMNPDKARSVEISNARNFLRWTLDQPMMVLHELAHGYHDQFLEGGHGNREIQAAYQRAKDAKLYDKVLRKGFKTERAYAMNNPMEYFAESTEAFFGTNDFYPFVVVELRAHDPKMYDLLKKLWGAKNWP